LSFENSKGDDEEDIIAAAENAAFSGEETMN
jgi:hypothetical protein